MRKRDTKLVTMWVMAAVAALFASAMWGQDALVAPDVAIIVSRTRAEAESVRSQLKTGFDFGVLAKERSIDPSSSNGGYIGHPSQLQPAFQGALQGVKKGEMSGVVPVANGFAVLTILKSPPKLQSLDEKQIQALVTAAVVRQNINVAGLSEADAAFAHYAKPKDWQQNLQQPCAIRRQSQGEATRRLEEVLASGAGPKGDAAAPLDLLRDHVALAQLHTFAGELNDAIKDWRSAYDLAKAHVPGAIPYLQEALGVSYLHLAETENGVYRNSLSEDLFPPEGPVKPFEKQENSRLAIRHFLGFLEAAPDDLQVRWLLNLAYLTLNEYPAAVPAKYLIPVSTFASKQSVGRFTDVAAEAGLNVFSASGGVIVDDFEGNGRLDVISSSSAMCDPLHYMHDNGDGTFTDHTAQAGLADQLGGLNVIQADYNNDGCMDFMVLRAGWEFPIRMSLMRNNCDGTFTDVTEKSGLGAAPAPTQSVAWADIDNDGYLDLFVAYENAPSRLFRNRGDGTFEDISHKAGIDKIAYSKGVVAADYDKDGYMDFYVSNFEGANYLYHNNQDLTFTEVAQQAGVQAPYLSFATWFFDYDNDGWPDLFVTSYYSFTDDQVLRGYLGLPVSAESMKLYRNLHDGTFQDVTEQVGLNRVLMPMGANFGDIDDDGFLDMYLGMGSPSFAALMPHVLLRNDGGRAFVDITASSGTGELHKGHGIAFADLERNGHEDIVAEIGGAVPSDRHAMRVFRNPGNDNDWINVRLTGVKSNRAGVGAEIKVTVENEGGVRRTIYRTVGQTSSFGSNPMEQHIGLGYRARIVGLEVWWPATKTRQQFSNVAVDQFLAVTEFEGSYRKLDRQAVTLGGSKVRAAIETEHGR